MFLDYRWWFSPKEFFIGIDQGLIPDFGKPRIQEVVLEEKTLLPQEPMPLRRSVREKRSVMPYDYIVFFWEHEVDI